MKKARVAGWLLFAVAVSASGETARWTDTFARIKQSIIPILIGSAAADGAVIIADNMPISGTGFFVGRGGHFITAAHVLDDLRQEQKAGIVIVPAGRWPVGKEAIDARTFRFDVVATDRDNDLALCKLWTNPFEDSATKAFVKSVLVAAEAQPEGTEVGFLGFPLHVKTPIAARGIVASLTWVEKGDQRGLLILVHAASWPGSSGSPLFLEDGTVIGVVSGHTVGEAQGITAARPGVALRALLAAQGVME